MIRVALSIASLVGVMVMLGAGWWGPFAIAVLPAAALSYAWTRGHAMSRQTVSNSQ